MPLPSSCDVLIVGAGPAGSAAAIQLARAGVHVVLVDQRTFPREKVCGDGLISDSLSALTTLGVRDDVMQEASPVTGLDVYPPYGRRVELRGEFACLSRERLDAILLDAARRAGAGCALGVTATEVLEDAGRVAGARVKVDGAPSEIRAKLTLLATGANATALRMFGLEASLQPTAVAGRAYFEAPARMVARFTSLIVGYHRDWCPGYGWIFPSPGNRFNIGVGLFTGQTTEGRLREFWQVFTERFEPAAEIVREATQLTPFRGAPLRASMSGASFGRAGLLTIGEAASLTYAATGEGIGKAMQSGIMAARYAGDGLAGRRGMEGLHHEYERDFRETFGKWYRAYSVAQRWAASPLILSLLAARTNASAWAKGELENLISERGDTRRLISKKGLLKVLLLG